MDAVTACMTASPSSSAALASRQARRRMGPDVHAHLVPQSKYDASHLVKLLPDYNTIFKITQLDEGK